MGRGAYWLGGLLILGAVLGAIAFVVVRLAAMEDEIDGYPKAQLSEGTVQLEARDYNVYVDVPGGTGAFSWRLLVRDAERREVPLRPTSTSFEYDLGGREGELIGKLRAPVAGRYLVRGEGPSGARVVFGEGGLLGSFARTVVVGLAIFFAGGAAGLVLIIVTAARRRRPAEPKRWP